MSFACDLSGDVALVTGASSGIGRHFALTLAANGAAVAATGRRLDRLNDIVLEITENGGRAVAVSLDVTDVDSIQDGFDTAESALGPTTIVINNAGVAVVGPIEGTAETDYDWVLDTNAKGAFLVAEEAGRRMISRSDGGRIINIGSISAFSPSRNVLTYDISKAAIAGMTRALAQEWAPFGIRVNAICPGVLRTEMTEAFYRTAHGKSVIDRWPRQRLRGPETLDGLLLLLAAREASAFMTGSLIIADDGQTL
jgi:NAD(P)-dependent dehydrogenase (short-subunit alcohol dehydrogenase family)